LKSNVIQFPTHIRQAAIDEEYAELRSEFEEFTDECRDTSQIILLMIEELLLNDSSFFDEIDFRDSNMPESRDMFVIVNMISSMLMKYGGVHHFLHDHFEEIYNKLIETTGPDE
jgi:hypothetical protein